ncbi:rod shape-determining protein RodA [Limnochorda pilosa]|uniref:Rod shape-determining protein RodA n=1 Tax=Limnochorda pilosa TaxID=1555112 RepID=A0A0K2SNM4_LIMPI|nr:rod shape-determining protein RodA [Limnochorda pilosa]BAS28612.1 rod shape-determining protein RodA [Limnochorda pilosa]
MLERRFLKYTDWPLLLVAALLSCLGLVAVYSATRNLPGGPGPYYYVTRQALWLGVGLVVLVAAALWDYRVVVAWGPALLAGSVLLLMAVLLVGPVIAGARRWLVLGPINVQPSELAKVASIAALAWLLSRREEWNGFLPLAAPLALMGIPVLLVLLEPDLGTSLAFIGILFVMLYGAGVPAWRLGVLAGLGVAAVLGAAVVSRLGWVEILKDYQIQRLVVFLDPAAHRYGAGWNVIQSMIAIGSGQFFGKGLLGGSQTQLAFLPSRHTDFVFSVVGEEWGFLGASLVLFLYFVLLWRILIIADQAKDREGRLLALGAFGLIFFHTTVNVGMAVGLLPVTGLPLPFVSSGGSNVVTSFGALGLALNVALRRKKLLFDE